MSVVWLIAGLLICWSSYQMDIGSPSSPGPGFLPFLSGLLMTGSSLAIFLQNLSRNSLRISVGKNFLSMRPKKVLLVFFFLVAYMLALGYLGFLLCTLLFMALLLKVGSQTWKTVVIGSICTAAGAYILFQIFLKSDLPRGFLGL